MEQKIFSKLNIYDQMGYLMVGAIFLFVIVFNTTYIYQSRVPAFNLNTFLAWFITAFFLGHLVQGIANLISDIPLLRLLIRESKNGFNEQQKDILQQVESYFGLEKQNENKLWNICNTFVTAKDITGQIQAFNAYYSLYRGWLVVFLMQSAFLLYHLFSAYKSIVLLSFIVSVFLSFIFYRRSKRFWKYMTNKVIETFIVIKTSKL